MIVSYKVQLEFEYESAMPLSDPAVANLQKPAMSSQSYLLSSRLIFSGRHILRRIDHPR